MKYKGFYVILLWLIALPLQAQVTREQMGGVYYAYPKPMNVLKYDDAPRGFHPFYIIHYGRHGSRWLPSDSRYEWVLEQFADKSNLTKEGKQLRRLLGKVWRNARGNGGQLTPLGARQHREIARRMVERFPEVFADNAQVRARSSVVNRCRASMLNFTDELQRLKPALRLDVATDSADMAYIAYTTPELRQLEKRVFPKMKGSPQRFIQSLFCDPTAVAKPEKLLSELHTIASDMQDIPLSINLYDFFTDEEFSDVYNCNNERMVFFNGDNPLNEGIPPLSALSLWEEMKQCADEAISDGKPGASLRFGHDTNLYRLLTLMNASCIKSGRMDEILPMAANLQMVFYRDQQGKIIVRFLHNERDINILTGALVLDQNRIDVDNGDLPPPPPLFYEWNAFCDYMQTRIHNLQHIRHLCTLNTMVGTAQANTQTAGLFGKGSEEHGQTLPAVLTPNGQNFWTPQTRDTEKKCVAPYYYADSLFQGFRCSHWIVGGCTQDYGSFTIAAMGGQLRSTPTEWATPFSHDREVSHPHYYAVDLPDEHLRIELTATRHCSIIRITPDRDQLVHVVLFNNSDEDEGMVMTGPGMALLSNPVHRIYQGWGEPAGFSGHLMVDYSSNSNIPNVSSFHGNVSLTFQGKTGQSIVLRTASSFTGLVGCARNMAAELDGKTFTQVMAETAQAWIDRLHTIDVESDDPAAVQQFYGALYRASFLPRLLSDVDGTYPRFANSDRKLITPGYSENTLAKGNRDVYTDFSMWDTYRAVHPLYNIIAPDMSADMMQSLVNMYSEGGWLPIFPCWNSYTAAMIGDHCSVVLADAYVKGIRNFDAQKAYEGMRQNAMQTPASYEEYKNGKGRRALQSYLKYGYIPMEDSVAEAFHTNEQTSRTLEYAFDDFAVAMMARELHQQSDYEALIKRSENWRNVINPRTGYADGRHANGRFENNQDIIHRKSYITEGATCHYTWYVPHNPIGLMEVMGGKEIFVSRLDSMFTEGRYWHGNEPCHQVAYLFDVAGQPHKTQQWVRHILNTEYNDTPGGLSGNDDAGQMSAWYVFSAMGFYPLCPATPEYFLASPTFKRVRINQPNGKTFTIEAPDASPENIYVKSASLNGSPLTSPSITHQDITSGSTLRVIY